MALSDGLQGWWCPSLDTAGNGTTTLTDLSGNGNNGTLTNMDAATDWVADTGAGGVRALDFDGADDYVLLPLPVSGYPFSLTCWVRYATTTRSGIFAVNSSTDANNYHLIQASLSDGENTSLINSRSGSLSSYATGATQTNDDAWHSLVAVFASATDRKLYVDGSLDASDSTERLFNAVLDQMTLGVLRTVSPTWYYSGLIDSAAIYNRVLTADEVTQLYNGGRSLNLLASATQSIVPQLLMRRRRLSGGLVI